MRRTSIAKTKKARKVKFDFLLIGNNCHNSAVINRLENKAPYCISALNKDQSII